MASKSYIETLIWKISKQWYPKLLTISKYWYRQYRTSKPYRSLKFHVKPALVWTHLTSRRQWKAQQLNLTEDLRYNTIIPAVERSLKSSTVIAYPSFSEATLKLPYCAKVSVPSAVVNSILNSFLSLSAVRWFRLSFPIQNSDFGSPNPNLHRCQTLLNNVKPSILLWMTYTDILI